MPHKQLGTHDTATYRNTKSIHPQLLKRSLSWSGGGPKALSFQFSSPKRVYFVTLAAERRKGNFYTRNYHDYYVVDLLCRKESINCLEISK